MNEQVKQIRSMIRTERDKRPNPALGKGTEFTNGAWFALDQLLADVEDYILGR